MLSYLMFLTCVQLGIPFGENCRARYYDSNI